LGGKADPIGFPMESNLITAMLRPDFYPEHPAHVELRQTHTSWVFLTTGYAYKVRKPVLLPFIDCSTPAKRLALCESEVRLNRRLAPDVYLGILPVVRHDHSFRFDENAQSGVMPVDYAVKMKRLPDEHRLDHLLVPRAVRPEDIEALAARLVEFHGLTSASSGWTHGSASTVWRMVTGNLSETLAVADEPLMRGDLSAIDERSRRFIKTHWTLLNDRARNGRVRDGHGDLRADSVYLLSDGVAIIDALEFSEHLRYCDVASEIAFLAMDLDRLGAGQMARELTRSYANQASDDEMLVLMPFYKCYRATVRAKVDLIRARQPDCRADEAKEASARAMKLLQLAREYAERPFGGAVIVVCGLSGTGKSTVARELQERLGFELLNSDVERKRRAGLSPDEHAPASYGEGIYHPEISDAVYRNLIANAEQLLRNGHGVIIDATFRSRADRARVLQLAERLELTPLFIECRAEPDEVIRRLRERSLRTGEVSDADISVYLKQYEQAEALNDLPEKSHIIAQTDRPAEWRSIIGSVERRIARLAYDLPA
jgi:aminoglycoside phosphotransferase family enzyme/predicted kinase